MQGVASPTTLLDPNAESSTSRQSSADQANDEARVFAQKLAATVRTSSPAATSGARTAAREVGATRTQLSASQASTAISSAYTRMYGQPPSAKQLAVLTAQWSLETGGGRSMMNFNFGGIKGAGPSGLTVAYRTHEGSGANQTSIVDHFRAYGSAEEGAGDYLKLLSNRYPAAFAAARNGDAPGFVRELKKGGYFTGSEESYTRNVTQISDRALAHGYDSLGGGGSGGNTRAPGVDASHALAFGDIQRNDPSMMATAPVDVMAFAYQLDQAALQIARDRSGENSNTGREDAPEATRSLGGS